MKTNEIEPLVGQYLFMVVRNGRSFPCNLIGVDGKVVTVHETDHDEWPNTFRRIRAKDVLYVIKPEELGDGPGFASDYFSGMRADANGPEDEAWELTREKEVLKAARKAAKKSKKAAA